MAYGKPCIVSSNAGASEIIKDGENGFVFDIKNNAVKNLAEKMIFLIDNSEKIQSVSKNAFETAKQYSWDRTFESFNCRTGKTC